MHFNSERSQDREEMKNQSQAIVDDESRELNASSKQRRLRGQEKFRLQSADLSKESNDYDSE